MKIPKPLLSLVAVFVALVAFGAIHPTHAQAQVSYGFFYDSLDPYGEWVSVPDYGYVWHPTNVDENWAPYTDGYWAYTDAGWTWVSYEDYGGIVYHYGRWTRIPGEGWVWVPGETWAPAWVSWRTNSDYIGWAPLPPEAHWRVGFGFGGGVDAQFDIGPGFYSFVGVGDFGAPALGPVIVNREQNVNIITRTTNITNITNNNSTVYTGGPRYSVVAAHSTRPIPVLKLVRQSDTSGIKAQGGKILSHQQGNQLMVIAPKVTATASDGSKPVPSKVARTLTGVKADHGWSGVTDPDVSAKLHAQFKSQAATASKSAKAVNPADVKLVTEKVKAEPTPKTAGEEGLAAKTPKTKKTKLSDADLENAPAAEEPGATPKASPGESPKVKKKTHATSEQSFLGTKGEDEATPKPKVKTPEETGEPDADATPRKKKHPATDLQPFTSDKSESKGDYQDEPKSEPSDKSYDNGPGSAYDSTVSKAPKSGKSKKKKVDENGNPIPPGQ
jgi:hypothetical protein